MWARTGRSPVLALVLITERPGYISLENLYTHIADG
jgi:hypothetical protein